MTAGKTRKYVVTVEVPDRVTDAEMRAYIADAVKSHGGAFSPDDPLFDLGDHMRSVRNHREPATEKTPLVRALAYICGEGYAVRKLLDDRYSVHQPGEIQVMTREQLLAFAGISDPVAQMELAALRWNALLTCARIRMQGSAGVDPKTGERNDDGWVHFGAEFWSTYPSGTGSEAEAADAHTRTWAVHALTALADDVIACRNAPEKS